MGDLGGTVSYFDDGKMKIFTIIREDSIYGVILKMWWSPQPLD